MIVSTQVYRGEQPTEEEIAELDALDNRPIDYSDIPATTPKEAKRAIKYWEHNLKVIKNSELTFA
ncbi:MAG: hypothetical protein J6M62_01970 [Selenomonadaceae bacterium]|nr:hypothetical protein [Selenomonadaceae bacterium]MBP3723011.1 hypothetical protein [Selenomonadaceae bacterium]